MFAEISSLDRLSQESSQPDGRVQVFQDSKHICGQQVFASDTEVIRVGIFDTGGFTLDFL